MAYTSSQVVQAVPTGINSALVLITAEPITASASFQVNGCFSATYDNYLVKMYLSTYVNGTKLRFGTSGTPNTGSIYATMYGVFRNTVSPNTNVNGSFNNSKFQLTVENEGPVFYDIQIFNPFATASTGIISNSASGIATDTLVSRGNYGGGVNGTTSFTDIVIIPDSGTIDGYIKIYGYTNSQDFMTTPQITIHDCLTGETITRDMNSAELAQLEADKVESEAQAKAESDAKAANDAKVLSAKNKLKALGLTEAEVTALVG